MGKGSNTTTTTQNSTYTPTGAPAINTALDAAQSAAATPYQAYGGELTAGVNQQQQTGIAGINSSANLAQPYYQTAQQFATNAGTPLTAAQITQYQNPYTQGVVNATQAQFNNQNQQQSQQLTGNAALQGALGGDRVGVAQANLANQQDLAQAPVIAGLYNQSYSQALAAAQQQQQQQGTAAGILGGLGTGAQAAGLSGAGAQVGAGTLQQQTQQTQDTSAYQQFLNQLAYPFQTSQFLTQATAGLAPSLGGTTAGQGTSTAPAPSPWGSILGGIATAASFLPSDERIKENKHVIGKMFDGTDIYRYNYKGDPTTRVGLLAQDVERKNPGAVAENRDGVKMVDHAKATDDAASRQHFAGGGLATPYGGAQGYVPVISSINTAQAPMPQMPSAGGGGSGQQPDQTKGMIDSLGSIGKSLQNSSIFDIPWDGGTPLEGGLPIGQGGIGHAARGGAIRGYDDGGSVSSSVGVPASPADLAMMREDVPLTQERAHMIYDAYQRAGGGTDVSNNQFVKNSQYGIMPWSQPNTASSAPAWLDLEPSQPARPKRIRGYDDGGLVPSQDNPGSYDSVTPAPFASYFDPASPVAGGVNLPLQMPKSQGFVDPPRPEPTPADSGLAAITMGVPLGDLPKAVGFDSPVPPPVDSGMSALGNGAPAGPVAPSQGFDAPAPVAAADVPLPPVRPVTGTEPISDETATNRATPTAGYAGNMDRIAAAHRATESSNNYGSLGPVNPKNGDRAYGAYQVMGANIPVWTKEILGKSMTPKEFLNDPTAQDAVYKAKMGSYINKYGMDGALRAWLGRGEKDFTGTTQAKYRDMFYAALGKTPEGDGDQELPNARYAQYRGDRGSLADESSAPSWADRNGLTNPFGQKLTPQSDDKEKDGPGWWPFGKMSDATKQQLMATGLGMMASKSPFLGNAIGEGGLQGISVAQKAQELSRQADLARATIAHTTAQTAGQNITNQSALETLQAVRGLRNTDDGITGPSGAAYTSPGTAAAVPKAGATTAIPSAVPASSGSVPASMNPAVPGMGPGMSANPAQVSEQYSAAASKAVAVQQTPQGPVAVDGSGRPVVNMNKLLTTASQYMKSGVPAYQTNGQHLMTLYTQMLKSGLTTDTQGNVIAQPGVAQAKASIAGAEEHAKVGEQLAKDGLVRNQDGTISPIPGFNPAVAATAKAKETGTTQAKAEGEGIRFNPDGSVVPVPGFSGVKAAQAGEVASAQAAAKAEYTYKSVQPEPGGPTVLMSEADIKRNGIPESAVEKPGAGSPPGGVVPQQAKGIIEKQPAVFAQRQEAIAKDSATMDDQYRARQVARERLTEIQDILKVYQPGAFAQQKASLIANARAIGLNIPDSATANPAKFEAFLKNATKNVFDDVKAMGGRVLVSEIQGLTAANANPNLQPAAARDIVGQGLGLLSYEDKHYEDFRNWYRKNPNTIDVSEFEVPWMKDNKPATFVKDAKNSTAVRGEPLPPEPDRDPARAYMLPNGKSGHWVPGKGWKVQN